MNNSYIVTDRSELKNLFEQATSDIKTLIKGGEVKKAASDIGAKYNIKIGNYTALANIITCILIGGLEPENVITAIKDLVEIDEETSVKIAADLETGILARARNITLGKEEPVAVLKFDGPRSPDELRKEILDTTKRESALVIPQTSGIPKKPSAAAPGSRSQLLEQLQILSSIPNDDEVAERLSKIQEQISSIKKKEDDNLLDSNIALKSFMFGAQGKETAEAVLKTATYSVAPTHYNLDPYREVPEE